MDFTFPIHHRTYEVIFRQPNLIVDLYGSQFDMTVWTVLVMTCILLELGMMAASWFASTLDLSVFTWLACE